MPFAALIYVETLGGESFDEVRREDQPRGARFVFGRASGPSPIRDQIARKIHKELGLAPNQRVVLLQTERIIINRISKAIEKAKVKDEDLPWLDAFLLVKSRLRKKKGRKNL